MQAPRSDVQKVLKNPLKPLHSSRQFRQGHSVWARHPTTALISTVGNPRTNHGTSTKTGCKEVREDRGQRTAHRGHSPRAGRTAPCHHSETPGGFFAETDKLTLKHGKNHATQLTRRTRRGTHPDSAAHGNGDRAVLVGTAMPASDMERAEPGSLVHGPQLSTTVPRPLARDTQGLQLRTSTRKRKTRPRPHTPETDAVETDWHVSLEQIPWKTQEPTVTTRGERRSLSRDSGSTSNERKSQTRWTLSELRTCLPPGVNGLHSGSTRGASSGGANKTPCTQHSTVMSRSGSPAKTKANPRCHHGQRVSTHPRYTRRNLDNVPSPESRSQADGLCGPAVRRSEQETDKEQEAAKQVPGDEGSSTGWGAQAHFWAMGSLSIQPHLQALETTDRTLYVSPFRGAPVTA